MSDSSHRQVFFISDRTGITAGTIGRTLLTQFPDLHFIQTNLPFINTPDKARQAVSTINQAAQAHRNRPLIFNTLLDDQLKNIVSQAQGLHFDFFDIFLAPLEKELGVHSSHKSGLSHGMSDEKGYMARIDALNFTLAHDDGINTKQYKLAQVILIGASRSGKTPSCLYLALNHGINAANHPLTDQDLESDYLPTSLRPYRDRLLGLSINADRLHHIREKRRPNSTYASLAQCRAEVQAIEAMYLNEQLPTIDVSTMSIEEIATKIIQSLNSV